MSQSRAMSVACLFTWHLSSCKMSNVIHPRRCFEAEYLLICFFFILNVWISKSKPKIFQKKYFYISSFFLPWRTKTVCVCVCEWKTLCVESLTATKQIFFLFIWTSTIILCDVYRQRVPWKLRIWGWAAKIPIFWENPIYFTN